MGVWVRAQSQRVPAFAAEAIDLNGQSSRLITVGFILFKGDGVSILSHWCVFKCFCFLYFSSYRSIKK